MEEKMDKPKLINAIYTCGPLEGRSDKEAFSWRDKTTEYLKKYGIETYNPGEDTTLSDENTITRLDGMMIDRSDALLVNLTCLGEDRPTNTGTLIEIGKAWEQGKLIVGFSSGIWKRENRFLRGIVRPLFFPFIAGVNDPLDAALEYIAGYNDRKRSKF
jgi:nucleoside 2-deoxyribosyltransferase